MSSTTAKPAEVVAVKPKTTSSTSGASILIGLQVGSRALTFLVNQILLRYLSPELLGISTQLEVYSISVLFFARESLRVAIQRQTDKVDDDYKKTDGDEPTKEKIPEGHVSAKTAAGKTQALVNLSYISIGLGVVFALVLGVVYSYFTYDAATLGIPYFIESLELYGIAAVWELLSEPFFVVVQQKSQFKIRARAESIATLLRCLATTGSAAWAHKNGQDIGVLPFALGQGAYAISLSLVYYISMFGSDEDGGFSFFPTSIYSKDGSFIGSYFSRPFFTLGRSIFAQSIFKHILTQGDTFLIAFFSSQRTQGVYALANNYGGLVARLVLQPIEESSRNYFGKLLSSKASAPSKTAIEAARENLSAILRTYMLISILIVTGGPVLAPIALNLVVGSRWEGTGVDAVLSVYCYYIPLLAINGLTEAFVSSVATKSEVDRQSSWMLAFSAGFGAATYYFLGIRGMGAQGVVWANAINMALRIIWSTVFIRSYFKRHGSKFELVSVRPEPLSLAGGFTVYLLLSRFEVFAVEPVKQLFMGAFFICIAIGMTLWGERDFLVDRYEAYYEIPQAPLKPGEKKKRYDIWGLEITADGY